MLFTSPYKDISLPTQDLPSFLFEYADRHSIFGNNPDHVTFSDNTSTLTYAELRQQSHMFASGLVNRLQLPKQSNIGILLPNTTKYPVVVLGSLMAGMVCALANPAYAVGELQHFLQQVDAALVVTTCELVPIVLDALNQTNLNMSRDRILTIDGTSNNIQHCMVGTPYSQFRITSMEKAQATPAFILQSSGTTGMPKGMVLSHSNVVCNILQNIAFEACDSIISAGEHNVTQQTHVVCLPFFHSYGLVLMLLVPVAKGHRQLIMRTFDLEQMCKLIETHSVSVAHLVPPIIIQLAKSPVVEKYDLSSLVFISCGAAPLTRETQSIIQKRIGCAVTQAYGLSEASPVTHRSPTLGAPAGSVGYLVPSMQCKIIDESGNVLGKMQPGELCVRGPNVMLGYLNDPEATAESIKNGFLHTGDIGYVDNNGFYFISDRKKELIKYKGFQVAPAELEGVLLDHSAVLDAAVIPVFDRIHETEVPKAFIVVDPKMASSMLAQEINEWLTKRVATYKLLRGGVEIVDNIPKSASGKILRRVLKDRERARRNRPKL
ncbi:hypothetical protein LPJ62_000718 [Coemansia sp. RSA 2167]|nr:hypothetical protein LPJ62_000718 [Coemansia sp. RSA 2167]KAJ2150613.1 hypothetical protein J3F82_003874 [Coemansia sp. RSA 637]KAJ2167474.1 hypothetical protein GGH16_003900 [Coemansia sp. RSA 560]KAJ2200044.1 hypothetical protein IW144_001310 [Coemansia sp. RSA 522]KAJ2208053.1 hypothetical protein IW145_001022 [Coemansia sp. RSA 521]KAJ2220500.1 hypothetical protein IW143_002226 [Coemansia sp. RSA 520]KAJ2290907.1 hypothetical protein IW141_002992 [Coemansia sp. RSA 355]KAJ2432662.1 hy